MGRPKPPEHDNRDDERRGRPKNLELRLVKATELSACNLGAMSDGIAHVINRLSRIADALEQPHTQPPGDGLLSQSPFVSEVHGRSHSMPAQVVVVPKMLDVEKILLSTMPRKADGSIDTGASEGWSSSDPSVGIEVPTESFEFDDGTPEAPNLVTCPGHFNCWALTPGLNGGGSVVSKRTGYADVEFQISYAEGVALSQNPSFGSPVSDTDSGV